MGHTCCMQRTLYIFLIGMNDGGATVVVVAVSQLLKLGIDTPPMANIVSWEQVRVNPPIMEISIYNNCHQKVVSIFYTLAVQ